MSSAKETTVRTDETPESTPVIALPDRIPDEWVKQINTAQSSSWWLTVLGSAVLAALIGWASSYFTARMTISANLALESEKIRLQQTQERMHLTSASYLNLASALNDLHSTFASYLVLVDVASEQKMGQQVRSALSKQFAEVGKAETKVVIANNFQNLIKTDVDSCLGKLVPVLVQADGDPKSVLAHQTLDNDIVDLMSRAQKAADSQLVQPNQ